MRQQSFGFVQCPACEWKKRRVELEFHPIAMKKEALRLFEPSSRPGRHRYRFVTENGGMMQYNVLELLI